MFSFGREAHYNNPGGPIYYPHHRDYYSRLEETGWMPGYFFNIA